MLQLGEWILEHYQKILLGVLVLWAAEYAYTRPYSIGDPNTYATLIVGQLLLLAIFHYKKVFFSVVMVAFLWAGLTLPLKGVWGAARWPVLLCAATVGLILWVKEDCQHFGAMHLAGLFCVIAAMTSAVVSSFPRIAFLKASSLLLLILYASSGARLAMLHREREFARDLLNVCEGLGYLTAALYFGLHLEIFGNPNSLGAVAGVVLAPLAMWGVAIADTPVLLRRRQFSLAVCILLVIVSRARAGLLSSIIAAVFLLLCLKRYRLFIRSAAVGITALALVGLWNPGLITTTSESVSSNVIYKGHRNMGLLGSREKPWNETMDTIREHPYFGGGFGTTATGADSDAGASAVETSAGTSREHGNSYLALLEWVGLMGIIPFVFLITGVLLEIKTVGLFMLRTLESGHPAVPLAMICLAGLVGAVFEDWLLAVGYYLSVFFWAIAFCLVDATRNPIAAAERADHASARGRLAFPHPAHHPYQHP